MPTADAAPTWSPATRRLVRALSVFDAHCDSIGRALDLDVDLGVRGSDGHLDLIRGREGGLGAWVVVSWVDPDLYPTGRFERAQAMMGAAHALGRRHPDLFRIVENGVELERARAEGVTAGVLGIEGGHAIEESLDRLEWCFEHGLRVMTLVWNNHLSWVRSCQDGAGPGVPEGLSRFGRDVVRRMNELGILVDLSHAGVRSFHDTLEVSTRPVIASHSGCRALHDHPRNLTDDQLRALAQHGGVVGIVFHPGFLDAEARAEEGRVRQGEPYRSLPTDDPARLFELQKDVMRREARPLPAARLVDHVLHAVAVAGVDHVGLGSDYDGIERGPEWLEDASGYGTLAELLLRAGLGEEEVAKILGGNLRRVFAEATGEGTRAATAAVRAPVATPAP